MSVLRELICADPGLPKPDSTPPYWLKPLHPLATVQSRQLPAQVDIVIVGSGITGLSLAKSILEGDPDLSVAVLEARTLCSGATGRNGGHLISPFALSYQELKKTVGKESALSIIDFTNRNVEEVAQLASKISPHESEIRQVTRLRTHVDSAIYEAERQSIKEYEADNPEGKGQFKFIDSQTCLKEHGINGVLGAAVFKGFAIWPYRFVMKVWQTLYEQHRQRLFIEACTPALSINYNGSQRQPYHVQTSRGMIQAKHVVHCTNAWSSHLLPGLRGRLHPYLECMIVQQSEAMSRKGHTNSWSFHARPHHSPEFEGVANGWTYLQQNAVSGQLFFGGTAGTPDRILTADDSQQAPGTAKYLRSKLKEHFALGNSKEKLVSAWTGCVARTGDKFPLVGQVSRDISGRQGTGEWVAAGFNGGGMCMSWLAGQAVAEQILGKGVSKWLPKEFETGSERIEQRLTVTKAAKAVAYLDTSTLGSRL